MNNINKKDVPDLIQKYIPQQAQEQAAGVNNTIGEVKSDSDNEMPTLDIHQQKKIKIQEEKIEAQQSESFTATVSHEMKTPLASTLFFI